MEVEIRNYSEDDPKEGKQRTSYPGNHAKTKVENVETIGFQYVSESLKRMLDSLSDLLKATGKKLQEEWEPALSKWLSEIAKITETTAQEIKVEFLTKDNLIDILRQNRVEGGDSCAVFKQQNNDGSIIIVATYVNLERREILPNSVNKNIVIECDGISRDLKILFGNNEYIIIK